MGGDGDSKTATTLPSKIEMLIEKKSLKIFKIIFLKQISLKFITQP